MSPKLDQSINRIDNIVLKKLTNLKNSTSIDDLQSMNSYLSEMKQMKDTLRSIAGHGGGEQVDYDMEDKFELVDLYLQGCEYITTLYSLIDYKKVEEADMGYLADDLQDYIAIAQALFGRQVPNLPILCVEDMNGIHAND
jgi:hypothetical protein